MNKNKAFSLMEVIVSVFILILVLIPSIKLNIQQIKTYSKIRNADSELHFFTSLNNYLKAENNIKTEFEQLFLHKHNKNINYIEIKKIV